MRLLAFPFALAASLATSAALAQTPPPSAYPAPPVPYAVPYAGPYAAPPQYIPWAPLPPAPVTERRSKGMMVTGIALWALGGLATGVGATVFGVAVANPCVYYDVVETPAQPASLRRERVGSARQALSACDAPGTIGMGVLTAGVLVGAVGIPFFLVGNSRVRVKAEIAAPEVHVSPTGAALRWTF